MTKKESKGERERARQKNNTPMFASSYYTVSASAKLLSWLIRSILRAFQYFNTHIHTTLIETSSFVRWSHIINHQFVNPSQIKQNLYQIFILVEKQEFRNHGVRKHFNINVPQSHTQKNVSHSHTRLTPQYFDSFSFIWLRIDFKWGCSCVCWTKNFKYFILKNIFDSLINLSDDTYSFDPFLLASKARILRVKWYTCLIVNCVFNSSGSIVSVWKKHHHYFGLLIELKISKTCSYINLLRDALAIRIWSIESEAIYDESIDIAHLLEHLSIW